MRIVPRNTNHFGYEIRSRAGRPIYSPDAFTTPLAAFSAWAVDVADGNPSWLPLAHRLLGRAYDETGNRSAARTALEKYLQLAPPDDPGRREAQRRLRDL